jgi:hypothetical protein
MVNGAVVLSVVPPAVEYAIVNPAARTALTTVSLKAPNGMAKK